MRGYKHSKPRSMEHRKKISLARMGCKNPNWGKRETPEHIEMRISKIRGRKATIEERLKNSESKKGEKCYIWKGGVSPINKRLRRSSQFRIWREEVFKRDNWTCRKCYSRGVVLHPHHIKNFAEYPELRFDVRNGMTLCENCHKQFHNRFNNRKNNDDQLAEYLLYKYQTYAI